mmetsp:Transcript_35999/g.6467  ORF Transcript_35999/g.6467 Transcript_35999/m.6467 type:complete len:106 (-) Transcript_35999:871-1188(-)
MFGKDLDDIENCGIIPRMINTIFELIENAESYMEFTVKISFCEIYMERIKDLLDPTKTNLRISEDRTRGIFIQDLTEEYVSSEEELLEIMRIGESNREVGATNMN